MGRQIVVDLHETDRDQAVEPCISNLLDHILICGFVVGILFLLLDDLYQLVTLPHGLAGNRIRFCSADIEELSAAEALQQRLCNAVLRNTDQAGIIADICNQLIPRPDRKILYGCLVHFLFLLLNKLDKLLCQLIYRKVCCLQRHHICQNRAILLDRIF